MRILIRRVVRNAGGGIERAEETFDGDQLTIGRATDQHIQIPDKGIRLSHSVIGKQGRHLFIRDTPGAFIFVNQERVEQSRIEPGDLIEVGNYRIVVSDPVEGYDYVLLVEPGEGDKDEVRLHEEFQTSLDETGLSKRRWSWVISGAILVACLAIPAAGLFNPEVAELLRDTPLPDDGQWDSGPLHASHRFIGDNCAACHGAPFEKVPDDRCMTCHAAVEHHVDSAIHQLPALDERRCANCHKEHNEPASLVRRDQGLCSDCHADLAAHVDTSTQLRDVSDFARDHPEFSVTMLQPKGVGAATTWSSTRIALDEPALEERSNLLFPHSVHMDRDGIESPEGVKVLGCDDCHRTDPSGAYMETVSMEQHCGTCHRLNFDPQDADREVPHGNPDVVMRTLEEYYARQFLKNQVNVGGGGAPRRAGRRPGQSSTTGALSESERSLALGWAQERALEAAEDIFERRVCKDCHKISIIEDPAHLSKWQVNPVRLTRVWMPLSFFDHESHKTESCADCHLAEESELSGDVLMPHVESCRACHGGEASKNLLASTCIDCHRFHIPGLGVMRQTPSPMAGGPGPAHHQAERVPDLVVRIPDEALTP